MFDRPLSQFVKSRKYRNRRHSLCIYISVYRSAQNGAECVINLALLLVCLFPRLPMIVVEEEKDKIVTLVYHLKDALVTVVLKQKNHRYEYEYSSGI